jgi:hypothetical protein
MGREQLDAHAIYERIAVCDLRLAADELAQVHRGVAWARRVCVT